MLCCGTLCCERIGGSKINLKESKIIMNLKMNLKNENMSVEKWEMHVGVLAQNIMEMDDNIDSEFIRETFRIIRIQIKHSTHA